VGSKLAKSNGFLGAIKIHSMTFFGGEIKELAPCCKILQHVKDPVRYDGDTDRQKFSSHFLPSFTLLHY
jgi:hypothetical protein